MFSPIHENGSGTMRRERLTDHRTPWRARERPVDSSRVRVLHTDITEERHGLALWSPSARPKDAHNHGAPCQRDPLVGCRRSHGWIRFLGRDAGRHRAARQTPRPVTPDWPRSFVARNGATVTIHQPQIAEWPNQSAVTFMRRWRIGRTARPTRSGTVAVEADTTVAFRDRRVHFSRFAVVDANFPSSPTSRRRRDRPR